MVVALSIVAAAASYNIVARYAHRLLVIAAVVAFLWFRIIRY